MTPEADLLARAMNLLWEYRALCFKFDMPEQFKAVQDLLNEYECMVLFNDIS